MNEYEYYHAALRGERPATQEDVPHAGLYRIRAETGARWLPVVIWTGLCARVNGQFLDPCQIWMSCANKPITQEEFDGLTDNIITDWRMRPWK